MIDEATMNAIRGRARRSENAVIPELGTAVQRTRDVAAYLEAFAQTYSPTHDKLMADRDAIADVLLRLEDAEKDRRTLLGVVGRLRDELAAAISMIPTNGIVTREGIEAMIRIKAEQGR